MPFSTFPGLSDDAKHISDMVSVTKGVESWEISKTAKPLFSFVMIEC